MTNTVSKLEEYNNFLGLNIGNSPSYVLKEAWANGDMAFSNRSNRYSGFVCIDTVDQRKADATRQDTSSNGNDQAAAMASSMKTMNMIMPLMSAWFCLHI